MTPPVRRVGAKLITGSLRRKYRCIEWLGELPRPPKDIPIVVYANHHVFDDGYVMCHLVEHVLERPMFLWMEQLDRFPFFKAMGAMPFPSGDAKRRVRTIRATSRQLQQDPRSVLIYFPEGKLHSGHNGVSDFPSDVFARLDRVLPHKLWWPITLRVDGWHRARPRLQLAGGQLHALSNGQERHTLDKLLAQSRNVTDSTVRTTLLVGKRGPDERWDFSRLARKSIG